jgi:hypothetical protein
MAPAIDADGTLYIASYCYLRALSPSGTEKWQVGGDEDHADFGPPAIGADGTVYVCSGSAGLLAVAPDGSEPWRFPQGASGFAGPIVGADGTIYLAPYDENLYAVNTDGSQRWRLPISLTGPTVPVVDSDGTIYLPNGYGSGTYGVYAVTAAGSEKWHLAIADHEVNRIGRDVTIGPNGTMYVPVWTSNAERPGYLYAIGVVGETPRLADSPWPMHGHDPQRTGRYGATIGTASVAAEAAATTLVSSPACCATEGGGAQVSFTLSADAAVTADVMNIAGRRIGHIVQDRELQAGANTLLWDGRSTRGLAVPAGMYLIRLTARDAEGGQSRSIGSLRLTR